MVATISYFIIFGIITIATGSPARNDREDSYQVGDEYQLQQLFQSLGNPGSYNQASNYEQDSPNAYLENRAGWQKPRQVYNNVKPQQYYKSYVNEDENQPNADDINRINQFLQKNEDNNNLIEELLSLDDNDKYEQPKPSDEIDDINEALELLGNLQKKNANVDAYQVFGNGYGNNLKAKKILPVQSYIQPKPILVQEKDGALKLVGNNPQYNSDYVDLDYDKGRNDNNDGSYNSRDGLRCNGKNCARTNRADKNNRLRCRGQNCARTRTDENGSEAKLAAQKIKVNDELDAVVLGLSDVDHLLSKLNAPKTKQPKNKLRGSNSVKLLKNVDLQNLLTNKNNNDKNNVEAVVFDLTQVENGDAIARQIKQLLSKSSEASYDDYEDYGKLVEEQLKKGTYNLQKDAVTNRATPVIMAHNENNNNVYLPKWLLNEVIKSYGEEASVEEQSESIKPLAKQQKTKRNKAGSQKTPRIFRRNNGDADVGVPFHLEVQGLGQVNP